MWPAVVQFIFVSILNVTFRKLSAYEGQNLLSLRVRVRSAFLSAGILVKLLTVEWGTELDCLLKHTEFTLKHQKPFLILAESETASKT